MAVKNIIMIFKIIFLRLPSLIYSDMVINIHSGIAPKLEFSGSDTSIISDAERSTFRIQDTGLKDAIEKFNEGKARPEDVFVRGPTPWNDLYNREGWKEIERTVVIKEANIVSNKIEDTIVASKKYHNDGANPINIPVDISQQEDNIIGHYWTRPGYITPIKKVAYNVKAGVNDAASLSILNSFMEDTVNILPNTLEPKSSNITLEPGKTAVAILVASKANIKVEVQYEASLQGSVACNYPKTFGGHFFWAVEINAVLKAGALPQTMSWNETLNVVIYADVKVLVYDLNGIPLN